jgi:hypothetical protein
LLLKAGSVSSARRITFKSSGPQAKDHHDRDGPQTLNGALPAVTARPADIDVNKSADVLLSAVQRNHLVTLRL